MEESAAEDIVSKYKRLLSLARSSLEANQVALAEKDKQIAILKSQLDSSSNIQPSSSINSSFASRKNLITSSIISNVDGDPKLPRNLLRRVDVNDNIWILASFDRNFEDEWLLFKSERDIDDFIRCLPGFEIFSFVF